MTDDAGEALRAAARASPPDYVLRLYVSSVGGVSREAMKRALELCDKHLAGRYHLEIIDIDRQTVVRPGDVIIAIPTLVKELPPPVRTIVGDLSLTDRVLVALDLKSEG